MVSIELAPSTSDVLFPKKMTYPVDRQQSERESRKAIGDLQPPEYMQIDGDPGEQEKQGERHMCPDGDLHFQ
jgi:hypothetical protein